MLKVLSFSLLAFNSSALAMENFDFILISKKCEMLLSFNQLDDNSLQKKNADLSVLHCVRNNKEIECDASHPESEKKVTRIKYKIHLDSPPLLMFSTDNGSGMVLIDTSKYAASYSSRMISSNFLGAKVCSMMFFTQSQYNGLNKADE